ncbi:enamine deaminase RidA [Saccharobesus litoralis]|uniref:Enamine deaminase RidA n=2 Tax=Saccharobesus litoralis TaxID=2172099 RepID=A0A2S0VXL6_9ALTE|nr:enamine deaminase RidA [Saccharobesus litoralis]
MNLKRNNYSKLKDPVGPYVHAVKHNDTLYVSGLTAFGTDNQNASIEKQAKTIFELISTIAKEEHVDLSSLIKVTLFVSDLSKIALLREELSKIYDKHIPASSLVKVDALFSPEIKIEVEAILALPNYSVTDLNK